MIWINFKLAQQQDGEEKAGDAGFPTKRAQYFATTTAGASK